MKKICTFIFKIYSVILFLTYSNIAQGAHIMGGDLTYTCIGANTYMMELTLFRDCNGATLGNTQTIDFFSPTCGTMTETLNLVLGYPIVITPLCPGEPDVCNQGFGQYGVHEYVYKGPITLTGCWANTNNITISWDLCCRNNAITTLSNNPGAVYFSTLLNTSLATCNNSPTFSNKPNAFFCVNESVHYNQGAIDPDNDMLSFSLIDCNNSSDTSVSYINSFSGTNPLASLNGMTIDSTTGAIEFTPNQIQVGVVCVLVSEYRNGIKIGEIVRDMQFTIINCNNDLPIASGINGTATSTGSTGNFSLNVCAGDTVDFDIATYDKNVSDQIIFVPQTVEINWNQAISGATLTDDNTSQPTANFYWITDSTDLGHHNFTLDVRDNGCQINGVNIYTFQINVLERPMANMNIIGNSTVSTGNSVHIANNTNTNNVDYFVMDWNDGQIDTVYTTDTLSHIYSTNGNYTLTLSAINDCFSHTNSASLQVSSGVCTDDAGTISATIDGTPISNFNFANWGSTISFVHSGGSASTDGDPSTLPGFDLAIYENGPPTATGPTAADINGDINYTGLVVGTDIMGNITYQNMGGYQTTFNGGDPIMLWFAPITLDNHANQTIIENVGNINECVNVNISQQTSIVFLNQIDTSGFINPITPNGDKCQAQVKISGGLPNWDASSYSINIVNVNNPLIIATIVPPPLPHTGHTHNSLVQFSVPEPGDYEIQVTDNNGATRTFTVSMNSCVICTDDAGTASANLGSAAQSNNPMFLCFGDSLLVTHNGNAVLTGDPNIMTPSGLGYVMYTCAPTAAGNTVASIAADPCIVNQVGSSTGFDMVSGTDINGNVSIFNNGSTYQNILGGIGQTGMIWFAPITVDNHANSSFENTGTPNECTNVNIGAPIPVVFLNEIQVIPISNSICNGSFSVQGGLPQYDTSSYVISIELSTNSLITGTVTNINPPSHGETVSFTVPQPGLYTITVLDNLGCGSPNNSNTFQVNMTTCPFPCVGVVNATMNITSNYNGSPVSCSGANDGELTIAVNGGTGPLNFSWLHDNALTTNVASGLGAGTYYAFVTDANGCGDTVSAILNTTNDTILAPTIVCAGITNNLLTFCWDTVAYATGYEISLNNGATWIAHNSSTCYTVTNLSPFQTVTIHVRATSTICPNSVIFTGIQSCTTAPCTLNSASVSYTSTSCFGVNDGTATISVSGGTPPYSYNWLFDGQITATAINLSAGPHIVHVADAFNCSLYDTVYISGPSPLLLELDSVNTTCANNDGMAIATVSGGSGGYTYSWNTAPPQTTATVTNLTAGTYTVTVLDANNCFALDTVSVLNDCTAPIITANFSTSTSQGCAPLLIQFVDSSISTLTGIASWHWDFGDNTSATLQNPNKFYTTGGTFTATLTVTDSLGNTANLAQTIHVSSLQADFIANTTYSPCPSLTVNFTDLSTSTSTDTVTWFWNFGDGSFSTLQNPTHTYTTAGTFDVTLTVTNAFCTKTITRVSYILIEPDIGINISTTSVNCFAGNDGTITANPIGGFSPYTYTWSHDTISTQTVNNLTAGAYFLTVTDFTGCSTIDTIIITQPLPLITTSINVSNPTCNGVSDGSATINVTGGTQPYNYLWSGGLSVSASITNISAGSYTVTVTDFIGCSIVSSIIITEPPSLGMTQNISHITCAGGATGAATLNVTGGTQPYSYNWSNNTADSSIINVTEGSYFVTITDANNCTLVDSVVIGNNCCSLTVNAGGAVTYCLTPDDITLSGYSPQGGIWSGSGIVNPMGIFNGIVAGGIGNYDLFYTYMPSQGCFISDTLQVSVIFGDTVEAGIDEAICIDVGVHNLSNYYPFGGTWSGTGIIDANNGIFDPQVAGTGLHTLTYTIGTGTCEKTDTKTIFVGTPPNVNAGADQIICEQSNTISLTGFSPINGIWSGTGIIDPNNGIFDPQITGIGSTTLTYTYINPITGCSNSDTKIITISPVPIVISPDTLEYCNSSNNLTLSGYAPLGGYWSGAGIIDPNNGVFNSVVAGGVGSYSLYYNYTDINGCSDTSQTLINIIFGDTVEAGPNEEICITQNFLTLSNYYPLGGTWSGAGIIDPNNGIFDPQIVGAGSTTLTYTYGSGSCQKSDTKTIFVGTLPFVEAGTNQVICEQSNPISLTGFVPTNGIWTGTGIIDSTGIFDPNISGIGAFTLTYTYQNSITGCSNFDTKIITVSPLPIVSSPNILTECNSSNNLILSGYAPIGGLWSGTGIIDANNGIFNSIIAGGVGSYVLTYNYTNANGCSDSSQTIINIIFGDTVEAGSNFNICEDATIQTLTGTPVGGTWSGSGIIDGINGIFDPSIPTVGSFHTLTYTYGTGTCLKTDNLQVFVSPSPTVDAGSNQTICISNGIFNLSGNTPSSGIWSGTGIIDQINGTFDPSVAGLGSHTITFNYTNAITGCSDTDTKIITILPIPVIEAGSPVIYCNNTSNVTLSGYSPAGGTWSGPGVVDGINGIFNSITAGGLGINNTDTIHQLIYSYSNGANCTTTDTLEITIIFGTNLIAGNNEEICIDDGLLALTGFSPAGGIWSGSGIIDGTSGIFDPTAAGIGLHTLTYTYGTGTCLKTASKTVFVGSLPIVSAGINQTICIDNGSFLMSGYSPIGGTWSGAGITNSINGIFDPQITGIGSFTLTYNYTNPVTGCSSFDTKTITVNPLPTVISPDTLEFCNNANNLILSGYAPLGGYWSGSGIVDANNGVFNSVIAGGVGSYVLTYEYTDNNDGCSSSSQTIVNIIFGDTIEAGSNDTLCISDNILTLSGYAPIGGSWSGNGIIDPNNGVFDPQTSGAGFHTLTYTYGSGSCQKSDTKIVFVGDIPIVDADGDESICSDELAYGLFGFPQGGTWSGIGITDSINGIFDPQITGIGSFTLTYNYTNPVTGCSSFDTKTITVNPLPTVISPDTLEFCNNANNVTLSGYAPLGGYWSGSGIVDANNGVFNSVIAGGVGSYVLTYEYTDNNDGCSSSSQTIVNIIFGDTVIAGSNDTLCISDNILTLSGYAPIGGSWSGTGIIDPNNGVFDPQTSGAGFHTLTYTYGSGSCQKSDTKTVFVGDIPIVDADGDESICSDELAYGLFGFPQGGTWSGIGITDSINGIFDPQITGIGSFTLTYNYTNPVTGCAGFDTKTITVNPLPTVISPDTLEFCNNANNLTLSGYAPLSGYWSGSGIVDANNGVFNSVIAGGVGSYVLTYDYSDGNGCSNSSQTIVNIIFGDTTEAGSNEVICISDNIFTLSNYSPLGGSWSGNGIIDPNNGVFDPQTAGAGSHTLTYTYGSGDCQKTDTKTILVGTPPIINAGTDQVVCEQSSPISLTGFSPINGIWSGTGIIDTIGIFDPNLSGIGSFLLTYTYQNPITGCIGTDTKIITVEGVPSINAGDSVTYCNTSQDITLTNYAPIGGTWTGVGIVNSSGIFNPAAAGGIGTYELYYEYTNLTACSNRDTLLVHVIFGDTVIAGSDEITCINGDLISLSGYSPIGGTWSGNGIFTGLGGFDPQLAGIGVHTLTYTYGFGSCQKTATKTITVDTIFNIDAGLNESICENTTSFTLTNHTPLGGTWSGTGITDSINGVFDPQLAGVGTYLLTYTYTHPVNNCTNSATKTITIQPLPTVTTMDSVEYCISTGNILLSGYSPVGGIWTGSGIVDPTNGIFNPQLAGYGCFDLTYNYTNSNGCTSSDTMIACVIFGDTVDAGLDETICINTGSTILQGSPIGGTWSGNAVDSAGIFDPQIAGIGTHTLSYTYGVGSCQKTDLKIITVASPPIVDAGSNLAVNIIDPTFGLIGFTPAGGIWSGNGIINDTMALFDPQIAGIGNHELTYTYTSALGCASSDTISILVDSTTGICPIPNLGSDIDLCFGDTMTLDPGISNAIYLWNTGETTASILVNPTTDTTFFVTIVHLGRLLSDTIHINMLAPSNYTLDSIMCQGEAIMVNGTIYNENNLTGIEILSNSNYLGCDSTVIINLSYLGTNPILVTAPNNMTFSADPNICGLSATWIEPIAIDSCGNILSPVYQTHQPNDIFNTGTTTITYIFDNFGDTLIHNFDMTIVDDIAPVFVNCPVSPNDTIKSCDKMVSWIPLTATDNCGMLSVNSTHQPNTYFQEGATDVYYFAEDINGNRDTCHFVIWVYPAPQVQMDSLPVSCYNGNDGAALATIFTGKTPFTYAWNTTPVQTTSAINQLSAGEYELTITEGHGCSFVYTTTITEPDPLIANMTSLADTSSQGIGWASVNPTGGTSPYFYNWSNNGSITDTIFNLEKGSYIVTITDANGCETIDSVSVDDYFFINANQIEEAKYLNIFPNPTNGISTIQLQLTTPKNVKIEIYNILGQLIKDFGEQNTKDILYRFDFSTLAQGTYFVKFMIDDQVMSRQVIYLEH